MDIAVDVRGRDILRQDVVVDEIFASLGAILEHRSHRRIGVDVRVLPFDVRVLCVPEGQLLVNIHQRALRFADLGMLGAIQDIGLRRAGKAVSDQLLLHTILYLLHGGHVSAPHMLRHLPGQDFFHLRGHGFLPHSLICFMDGAADLVRVKLDNHAVALFDLIRHLSVIPSLSAAACTVRPADFFPVPLEQLHLIVQHLVVCVNG